MGAAGLPQPKARRDGSGPRKKFMVIRPSRESATGWTRRPKAVRATSHYPLNEPGLALNVFWLPDEREEGVRRERMPVRLRQAGLAPKPGATRWNQMGD